MALNFYCGSPGAGKSYHVVRYVIIPALKDKRNILTNLPLKLKEIYEAHPELKDQDNEVRIIDKDKIQNIHLEVDKEEYAGWLIVIDEAHDFWPSYQQIIDVDFRSWLSQHRHKFQDLILITQDFTNVNKFVRSMVKERFEFEKNDSKGFEKSYMQDFYLGSSKKRAKREIHRYDPVFFEFYYSHDIGLAGSGFKEQRTGKKMNLMKKPLVMLVGGAGMVFICFVVLFNNLAGAKDQEPGKTPEKPVSHRETIRAKPPIKELVGKKSRKFDLDKALLAPPGGKIASNLVTPVGGWCQNVKRVKAGIGAKKADPYSGVEGLTRGGGRIKLRGAYTVVGSIVTPLKAIYIIRDQKAVIFRVKFKKGRYSVGQRICL